MFKVKFALMAPLLAPDYIRSLNPYVPGKPIEETQREFKLKRVIKLASNENPLGPSPLAVVAVKRAARELHRYPDASAFHLKSLLAKKFKLAPEALLVGNGSNEIIDFLIRTYCLAGDQIVTSQAAFIAYKICAQIHGVQTLESPLTEDLRFDLEAMAELVRKNQRAKIVFIPNPNNPTGTYVDGAALRSFLKEVASIRDGSVLVVLDYAYWEYVSAKDLPEAFGLMRDFPNVVVLRTFSKVYGLAGLRVGFGAGSPEIISTLEKVRQPFNMNSMGLIGAQAALSDTAFVARSRKLNEQGKKFWEKELKRLSIPFWPTQGNFVLTDVGRGMGRPGAEVYQECLKLGVIFRPVANYGLLNALRISIGTDAENRLAAKALEAVQRRRGR
jgi:histidinol-phosphate aminotransferase